MIINRGRYTSYPMCQIRPYGYLLYNRIEVAGRREIEEQKQDNRNKNYYTGTITPYSKKRLTRAITLLVASSQEKEATNFKTGKTFKFKVNFITLTLPAPQLSISDKQLKKECLDNWIKRMKRKYGLRSYVWRAERQKNGNLHFHIITDSYIRYDYIRNDWNSLLSKFHFIRDFKAKHGHDNPNSTDVHSILKVNNLVQYFVKYMSKGDSTSDKIEGKIWDCSINLKPKVNCEFELSGELESLIDKAIADESVTLKNTDVCSLVFMKGEHWAKYTSLRVRQKWDDYLRDIREFRLCPRSAL